MNTDKIAIDANVLLYAYDNSNINKQDKAIEILLQKPFASQLVIFEFIKVLERKFKMDKKDIMKLTLKVLEELVYPLVQHSDIHNYAHFLVRRYNYGLSDILILSDSILNNCSVLLSEDMCDGMVVDKKLKIVNPFL
ncbi:PIN domain-containing protein [Chryseobacterium sp. JUb7]|uniref:PIN domain-containing protein n=1 Tax=Chryseobacterium sp. JUb7 TaxID=2940599 RepID=UPI00216A2422|nr:PIN domain-containing protein [Chryseobacterium sp. JUb7]MCS3531722.1 putative nucleic acid-binding protein [Chryseobacterium sp. JUb7]